MKRILIPTDFSIGSLSIVHNVVAYLDEPVEIVLFHAVYVSNSISDLLFINRKIYNKFITGDYTNACEILKNKYSSQIKTLKTEFFYGSTKAAFNNFAEGNKIDFVTFNEHYNYKFGNNYSVDIIPIIKKSKCNILPLYMSRQPQKKVNNEASLSELLLSMS